MRAGENVCQVSQKSHRGIASSASKAKRRIPPIAPALARFAQDEESGLCGGDARSGGRLGEMTRRKREIVGLRNERDFPASGRARTSAGKLSQCFPRG